MPLSVSKRLEFAVCRISKKVKSRELREMLQAKFGSSVFEFWKSFFANTNMETDLRKFEIRSGSDFLRIFATNFCAPIFFP